MARRPRLILIADLGFAGDPDTWIAHLESVAALTAEGVWLQLRVKLPDSERRRLYERAAAVVAGSPLSVTVNGSVADALAIGAAGVHWPEAAIPHGSGPEGRDLVRSASVHSPDALARATAAGVDYALAGPVFDAGSKPVAGRGLDWLGRLCDRGLSVIAVGGIGADNAAECMRRGASGVAVVSAVFGAAYPEARARAILSAVNAAAAS